MKHAGGGFEYSYDAQTAVDATAHIIVAAVLGNCAADSGELPTVLSAVKRDAGADPEQVLADAGHRSEEVFEQLQNHPVVRVNYLGRTRSSRACC